MQVTGRCLYIDVDGNVSQLVCVILRRGVKWSKNKTKEEIS